jgi:hypothetical protein
MARKDREGSGSGRAKRRVRALLLAVIGLLYLLSIPWYRAADPAPALSFGMPDWAAFALGCYLLVAILNAAAWLLTEVPDADPDPDAGQDSDVARSSEAAE